PSTIREPPSSRVRPRVRRSTVPLFVPRPRARSTPSIRPPAPVADWTDPGWRRAPGGVVTRSRRPPSTPRRPGRRTGAARMRRRCGRASLCSWRGPPAEPPGGVQRERVQGDDPLVLLQPGDDGGVAVHDAADLDAALGQRVPLAGGAETHGAVRWTKE